MPLEAEPASSSFTEVFVERLIRGLHAIPSHHAGGIGAERLHALLQSQIGVEARSTRAVVSCLATLRLIADVDSTVGRTTSGDRVRRGLRDGDSRAIVLTIVRSGFMADQIRSLRTVLRRDSAGYACSRSAAQAAAPQLVGLLARMPDVSVTGQIEIGRESSLELDSVWNELAPSGRTNWQDVERRRKAIGDRAELYSLQRERSSRVGAWRQIHWVSRDDDSLGYDIEVLGTPTRRIEVKGSSGTEVQFFLSTNEYQVAGRHGSEYELHFWGGIDLQREPSEDYERLLAAGYPIRVEDPASTLTALPWTIEPSQYRVSRPRA